MQWSEGVPPQLPVVAPEKVLLALSPRCRCSGGGGGGVGRKSLIFFLAHVAFFFLWCKLSVEKKLENVWHVTYSYFVMQPTPKTKVARLLLFEKIATYAF